MNQPILEVCVDRFEGALIASQSGADRIELCEQLEVGGITPSDALLQHVRSHVELPIIALIRSRAGGFEYDASERSTMIAQAIRAIELGADGVAVGACLKDKSLDFEFLARAADAVLNRHPEPCLVLHRVFDSVPHPANAIPELKRLGFHRILTSGGGILAIDHMDQLAALQRQFGESIEILPAGGIDASNARQILEMTGCRQLHGSLRTRGSSEHTILPSPLEIAAVRRILSTTRRAS
jgi:copper homeostasis protein